MGKVANNGMIHYTKACALLSSFVHDSSCSHLGSMSSPRNLHFVGMATCSFQEPRFCGYFWS